MSVLTPLFLTTSNTEHLKNRGQEEKSKQFIVANIQKGGSAGPHPEWARGSAQSALSFARAKKNATHFVPGTHFVPARKATRVLGVYLVVCILREGCGFASSPA